MQQPASLSCWLSIVLAELAVLHLSMPATSVAETGQHAWTALVFRLGITLSIRTAPKTFSAIMRARTAAAPRTVPVSGGAVRLLMCAASAKAMVQAVLTAQGFHWAVPWSITVASAMTALSQIAVWIVQGFGVAR